MTFFPDDNKDFEIPGPYYLREMNNKREAREIMKSSGWLDKLSYVENSSFQRFSPTISRTHIEWASCVKVE